jgi:hypothetical protein
MLNRLVEHMKQRAGVSFTTMADVAREWKRKNPLKRAAR